MCGCHSKTADRWLYAIHSERTCSAADFLEICAKLLVGFDSKICNRISRIICSFTEISQEYFLGLGVTESFDHMCPDRTFCIFPSLATKTSQERPLPKIRRSSHFPCLRALNQLCAASRSTLLPAGDKLRCLSSQGCRCQSSTIRLTGGHLSVDFSFEQSKCMVSPAWAYGSSFAC